MLITVDALVRLAERHADKARQLAEAEVEPRRKQELARIAEIAPGFRLTLPHVLGSAAILLVCPPGRDHGAEPLGRLHPRSPGPPFGPFYQRNWPPARLSRAEAEELLQCLGSIQHQPAPAQSGVTAQERHV